MLYIIYVNFDLTQGIMVLSQKEFSLSKFIMCYNDSTLPCVTLTGPYIVLY